MEAGGGNASTVRLPVVGERTVVPHDPKKYLTRGALLMEVARNPLGAAVAGNPDAPNGESCETRRLAA
jgi:hypothetical protein